MNVNSILLTELTEQFTQQYLRLVNDPAVRQTTDPHAAVAKYNKEDITKWLASLATQQDRKDFAIILKDEGMVQQCVGEVVLNEIKDHKANLRIAILSEFFDQGIGSHAMKLAIDKAFRELGLAELNLSVFDINPRGIRVYEKLGFQKSHTVQEEGLTEIHMRLVKEDWLGGIAQQKG